MYTNRFSKTYLTGDRTYFLEQEHQMVKQKLTDPDLTKQEREQLLAAEHALLRKIQLIELAHTAKQKAQKNVNTGKEAIHKAWHKGYSAKEELFYIQMQLVEAFESKTADRVQMWLKEIEKRGFREHLEAVIQVEEGTQLDL